MKMVRLALALAVVSVYWTAYGMFFLRAFYVDFPRVGAVIIVGMLTLILIIPLWLTLNRKLDRWTGRWRVLLPVALLAHGGWLWLLVLIYYEPHLTSSTVFEDNHTTTIYYLVASVLVVLALQGIAKIRNAWGKIALALSLLAIETVGLSFYWYHLSHTVDARWLGKLGIVERYHKVRVSDGSAFTTVVVGNDSLNFLIDTGADFCVVDERHALRWELDTIGTSERFDFNGRKRSEFLLRLPELVAFDSTLILSDVPIIASDYSANSFGCQGVDGILGVDVLSRFNWSLDLSEQLFYQLADSLSYPEGFVSLPMVSVGDKKPRVSVEVGGRVNNITFDTGANGYIHLKKPTQAEIAPATLTTRSNTVHSHFGEKAQTIDHLDLDTILLGSHPFAISDLHASSGRMNLVGTSFFAEYPVIFDFVGRRLLLDTTRSRSPHQRTRVIDALQTEERQDLGLSFQWKNDSTLVVGAVHANSPAALHDLRSGDTVAMIDNRQPSSYFADYCEFLDWNYRIGQSDSLEIRLVSSALPVRLYKTRYRLAVR